MIYLHLSSFLSKLQKKKEMSKLDKFAFQFLKVQLTVVKTLKPSKYPVKFLPLEADLQELLITFRSFLLLDVCLFGDH